MGGAAEAGELTGLAVGTIGEIRGWALAEALSSEQQTLLAGGAVALVEAVGTGP